MCLKNTLKHNNVQALTLDEQGGAAEPPLNTVRNSTPNVPYVYRYRPYIFDATNCELALPIIDMLTFTLKLGIAGFNDFKSIMEQDTGRKLLHVKTHAGRSAKKCQVTGITIEENPIWGTYKLYLRPNKENLSRLQSWLEKFFHGCIDELRSRVRIYSIELAYDFIIPNINRYVFYHSLVQRIVYSLWPKGGQNLYSVWLGCDINEPYYFEHKDIKNKNGEITCYIQGAKRDKKHLSSESINYNYRASKHTKIYPKEIDTIRRARIEMELSENCKDMEGLLDYSNFSGIIDKLPEYPFSRFYEFMEVDFDVFIKNISKKNGARNILNSIRWSERIEETRYMPVVDQIRIMRALAKEIGSKKLGNKILPAYTKTISFTDAINKSLPKHATITHRTKPGEKPDKKIKFRDPSCMKIKCGPTKILRLVGAAADTCPKKGQNCPS